MIDGWPDPQGGVVTYLVWLDGQDDEVVLLAETELRSTGERRPPPSPGRPATSIRVSEAGAVLGEAQYTVIADVIDLL